MMSEFNPNQLSDDDLEKALSQGDDFVPPSPEGEPTHPPETDTPQTDEAEPTEAPTPDEPKQAESEADLEAERLRLLSEELEAKAKHWESVAGRNAGELGFIKSQLKTIQAAQLAAQQGDYIPSEPGNGSTQPSAPTRNGLAEWAVQQAVTQTVSGFESSHPDTAEMQAQMVEYIKTSGYDMQAVLAMDNPIDAQREIGRALEEAYWHTKAAVTSARRAELSAKREAIQTQAATNKMKASVSATASTPPPKPKAKTQDEMSDAELEAEMVRAMNGRW